MAKCAVIVKTDGDQVVVAVKDYRDSETISAVAKVMGVEAEDIKLCSSSMSGGIFQLVNYNRKAEKLATNPVEDSDGFATIEASFGHILEV